MGFIYPGLTMRVAPSVSPAGVLEFVMDPLREAHSKHTLKEASTGRYRNLELDNERFVAGIVSKLKNTVKITIYSFLFFL